MTTEEEITEAELALKEAGIVFDAASKRVDVLRLRQSEEQYGIKPGVRIQTQRHRKIAEGIVATVKPWGSKSKPWVYAKLLKKNGKPSERETCVYSDWEIIAP